MRMKIPDVPLRLGQIRYDLMRVQIITMVHQDRQWSFLHALEAALAVMLFPNAHYHIDLMVELALQGFLVRIALVSSQAVFSAPSTTPLRIQAIRLQDSLS